MGTDPLTIIVSGMIAADPHQGGATWAVLQYVLGLRELGHDVFLIEPVKNTSLGPTAGILETSVNAAYFRDVTREFRLEESAALLFEGTRQTVGLPYETLLQIAKRTDVLLNISGMLTEPELIERIPLRVYLDLDPAFNQLWHVVSGIDMRFAAHNRFVTVGQAIGRPGCKVPTCGLTWIPTLPPIVLTHWQPADTMTYDAFTTVGHWRAYGSVEHAGVFYGQKAHSLRPLLGLPRKTEAKLLLAMAIHADETKDLAALNDNGWGLIDPAQVAATPTKYRDFVRGSRAELGIAKSGYVVSRCGWFSDRSACYLTSGRPVLAQDTGFKDFLPTGHGLLTFSTVDEAAAGIDAINSDYSAHCRAARELAEEHFAADKVLKRLLCAVEAL